MIACVYFFYFRRRLAHFMFEIENFTWILLSSHRGEPNICVPLTSGVCFYHEWYTFRRANTWKKLRLLHNIVGGIEHEAEKSEKSNDYIERESAATYVRIIWNTYRSCISTCCCEFPIFLPFKKNRFINPFFFCYNLHKFNNKKLLIHIIENLRIFPNFMCNEY